MARTKQMIEADLSDCTKAIAMFMGDAKAFERYVRRRNELIIELQLAEMPVHKQHEEVGVNIDFTTTKLLNN